MTTSVFGTTSTDHARELFEEALQDDTASSDQDGRDLAIQSPNTSTDDLLSSSQHLPTWDDIPFINLPDKNETSFGYELRPGPRMDRQPFFFNWLDQDRTATYDPKDRLDPYIYPPAEIFETRPRRQEQPDENSDRPQRPKTSTWQRGRIEGKRLPVTLSFATEQGKGVLASYSTTLDNWPKSAFRPPNEEIDWNSWWNPCLWSADDNLFEPSFNLRERQRRAIENSDEDAEFLDNADLTGHPVARGCKGCLSVGQRCPLLDEGSTYPCEICVEDNVDCELIREPAEKGTWLNCGQKRIRCSYREENSNHKLPCTYCATQGLKCIAGPASGRTRTGPALDSVLSNRNGLNAKDLPSHTQRRKARRSQARSQRDLSNSEGFAALNIRLQPSGNPTQFIMTKLPHPIELSYVGNKPCHWCQDLGYGIVGLGDLLEVQVVDFQDGNGYIELDGGYFGAGCESSRMCNDCTFERLAIAACLKHDLQDLAPIEGMDPDNFNYDGVMDYLAPGRATSAPFPWCSICPNAAFIACCKAIDVDTAGLDDTEQAQQQFGCGLRLCEGCAISLINDSGGDLETVVEKIKDRGEEGIGLRADVDLILPGGELVRRLGCQ